MVATVPTDSGENLNWASAGSLQEKRDRIAVDDPRAVIALRGQRHGA